VREPSFKRRGRRLVAEMLRRTRRLRLQQTAASLAFLSLFAAVPVFSIALSVLSALPVFDRLQEGVQQFLLRNLFPEAFSGTVIRYLQEFAGRATRLSLAGAVVFFMTAITSLRVIETTMNAIWATSRRRSLAHRFGLYWALLTLTPLALGAVLALNGRVIAGLLVDQDLAWLQSLWFTALPWLIGVAALWLLFLLLPAARVPPLHALAGAALSAGLLAVLQRGLSLSVRQLPTYEIVYGAFAALPLLLIWLFLVWSAVLAGALLAASLRHWSAPLDDPEPDDTPGRRFDDALVVLRAMLRATPEPGAVLPGTTALPVAQLHQAFGADAQRAEQAAELLERLGYLIRLVQLGGSPMAGAVAARGSAGESVESGIWAERWVWASPPQSLALRRLFDDLWWAGQPAAPASWQGERLELPLAQALAD
jgi:membrane protein